MAEGFSLEDYAEDMAPVEVWPENHEITLLFRSMQTQWLAVGGMGFIRHGLRYEALYPLLDRISEDKDQWGENFAMIRAMEQAALEVMNKKAQ